MWSKYLTRRLATQVAQAWNSGIGAAMRKVYGISIRSTLVFRDARKTEYYLDEQQRQRYVAGLRRLLLNEHFLRTFHRAAQAKLEAILRQVQKVLRRDLTRLSNAELLKLYRDFILPNQAQFYVRMWTVFNLGDPLVELVRQCLRQRLGNEEQVTEYLLDLSSPLVPNDVLNERRDLLRLALERGKLGQRRFERRLARHTAKYCHIPMFDFDHEPYDAAHFRAEMRAVRNPAVELAELRQLFRNRQRRFRGILKRLKPTTEFKRLLLFLKENVFLRDYRDRLRQQLNLELKKFYQEVGKRLELSVTQVATLTNGEIIDHLRSGKPFPHDEVKRREQMYLLIQQGSKAQIYSGRQALAKARQELPGGQAARVGEIRGTTGALGRARGIVKVVFTNRDLAKVKRGDVLVAPMTRQDFVSAMRRAVAIVTDEGSVTAHAAIIARELRLPCVVATRIATRVLKDGDRVEVDAGNGIVRILRHIPKGR